MNNMDNMDKYEAYEAYVKAAGEIGDVLSAYKAALSTRMGINIARDRLKNVLFSNADVILTAVRDAREMSEEIVSLTNALEKADKEYDELKKKLPKPPKKEKDD